MPAMPAPQITTSAVPSLMERKYSTRVRDEDLMTDEADILFALIRARYAARLDAAQLEELRQTVEGLVRDVATLRAADIPDDAEPAQPFVPFRAP
jgi:hypothetical protein